MKDFASTRILVALVLALLVGAATQSQSAGPIEQTGVSPRIEKLKEDLARGTPGVADMFWAALAREHTPMVEPVAGDPSRVLVTLLWRGGPGTRSVRGFGTEMVLIPNTDIWYETFTMLSDHRLWYWFKPTSDAQSESSRARLPDPLNPHRFVPPVPQERPASAINHASSYMSSSILVLPDAPTSPWVDPQYGVAPGRVEERSYQSKVYGTTRRIWVYTSPTDSQSPSGLLICLWGMDYLNEIPVPTIFAWLRQAAGLILRGRPAT